MLKTICPIHNGELTVYTVITMQHNTTEHSCEGQNVERYKITSLW